MAYKSSQFAGWCVSATGALLVATPSVSSASQSHTVKPGENLSTIARKYHVTAQDIAVANHLGDSDAVKDGVVLAIPAAPKGIAVRPTMHVAGAIHGDRISVRLAPNTTARRVDMFDMGAPLVVTAKQGGWCQVSLPDGRHGWVREDFVQLGKATSKIAKSNVAKVKLAKQAAAKHVSKKHVAHAVHIVKRHFASVSHAAHRSSKSSRRGTPGSGDVVRTAIAYRGTPYHFGGTGRSGFDCSGFTSYIYKQKGVALPHNAAAQFSKGAKVSKSELKPGDLVFFHCGRRGISHVGIYAGNGKFVHASSPRSGGVRVDSLVSGYYKSTYRGARRVKK